MSKPSERIAIVGSPNSGKSSLFNRLTGLRQKVANYPGVTVEKRAGTCVLPSGKQVEIVDLPGTYSLNPRSPDEALVLEAIQGPDAHRVVAVVDATRLDRQLFLALQILATGRPAMLVLNLMDEAEARGIEIDVPQLSRLLGVPVLAVSAKSGKGMKQLREAMDNGHGGTNGHGIAFGTGGGAAIDPVDGYREVESIVGRVVRRRAKPDGLRGNLDAVLTHRVLGPVIFIALMATVFQGIYAWATPAMDLLDAGFRALAELGRATIPAGPIRSLLLDGVLAGVGTVAAFLPQLAILFFFIALMEDTGYMARAAFLMDRVMASVGLPGRAFLPLLSSFACAIPGIMATRTMDRRNDRLATILIAPFMSCSARLPVYALLIGAFIPDRHFLGFLSLRGLTLLSMYLLGIVAALAVAWIVRRTVLRGPRSVTVFEMPPYRMPQWRSVFLTIRERCLLFLEQAGTVIVAVSIVLWALATYPSGHPETKALTARAEAAAAAGDEAGADALRREASGAALRNSFAGQLGHAIEPLIAPLGFDWKLGVGIVSSIAAREVMISTMATMNNLEGAADPSESLRERLPKERDPVTGLPVYTPLVAVSLMVFFALAFQCMSTVAVARRETNSWRWPIFMLVLMNGMAWVASLAVYQGGKALGWG
ncbi:MAG TPA: ferrous iron transport protein B [Candidatus Eisenbacteria bacterium]|nr:ferrous iron transport protein B [Candidatus Eisenbacteria bacterium]